jgi:hypothetical protein
VPKSTLKAIADSQQDTVQEAEIQISGKSGRENGDGKKQRGPRACSRGELYGRPQKRVNIGQPPPANRKPLIQKTLQETLDSASPISAAIQNQIGRFCRSEVGLRPSATNPVSRAKTRESRPPQTQTAKRTKILPANTDLGDGLAITHFAATPCNIGCLAP